MRAPLRGHAAGSRADGDRGAAGAASYELVRSIESSLHLDKNAFQRAFE